MPSECLVIKLLSDLRSRNEPEEKKSCFILFQHSFQCLNAYMQFASVLTLLLAALGWISPLDSCLVCLPVVTLACLQQREDSTCTTLLAHVVSEWSKHEFTMRHTALKLMFPVM